MKIGILTHYNVINNGATLQMYALKSWLEENGHDVYILTYKKNFDYSEDAAKKYNFSLKNLFYIFKMYFIKGSPSLFFYKVRKQKKYKKFIKRNFKFLGYTKPLDLAIVGSDEVFSLEVGCNKMMYGHDVNANKIISYAPSFGQTDMEVIKTRGCVDIISSGLKKFSSISVRDTKSRDTIRSLIGVDCDIVCDPVILYDFSSTHTKIKTPKHKYLLLYSYDKNMNSPEEIYSIKAYAKKKGLKVISAGTYHKWCDKNINCNPLEWIEYFRNAEEVITDTFHGAVLSIITQKKALVLRRSINGNKLTSLIEEYGLDNFLVDKIDSSCLNTFSETVYNGDDVLERVKAKRLNGAHFLKRSLKDE